MDEQIPGSSRPKRQCTDFYKKKPLSDRELEELAEAFSYSESEVEISHLESESEISDSESNIDIPDTEDSRVQGTTPDTSIVTSETINTAGNHCSEKYTDSSGKAKRKRCKVCYSKNIRKDTSYYCPACPGSPGLCLGECFREHHN